MNDIRARLYSFINSETRESTDNKIAFTIYENLDNLKNVTSSELASICNVSTSAITRFCKRLGLEGFFELHYLINYHQRRPHEKFFIENIDSKKVSLIDYVDLQIDEIKK